MEFFTCSYVDLPFLEYIVFCFCGLNVTAVVNVIFSLKKRSIKKKGSIKQSNFCSTLTGNVVLEKADLQKLFLIKKAIFELWI